jgi:tRNA(Ile)-lysidine synthase
MKKTEQLVIDLISRQKLISAGDKILVAFSGGADSVFLLSFLLKFRRKYKIELAAFHLNHLLRKKAAQTDEEFCRNFCNELGVPFYFRREDIKIFALKEKISVEEAGRKRRYDLLAETAKEHGLNKIATGHNLDDNTETVILNLVKGTGIKGISGIPYIRGNIIRPLLAVSKDDIRSYLKKKKVPYLTDKTNLQNDYERNFLRNKIIPLLKKRLNPSVDGAILRSSDVFKSISGYMEERALEGERNIVEEDGNIVKLRIDKLQECEAGLVPEIIKNVIERNFLMQLSFNDIQSVLSLIDKTSGKGVDIPGRIRVTREREHLIVAGKRDKPGILQKVDTGGHCEIDGKTLFIEQWTEKVELSDNRNIEFISGDNLGDSFIVRTWRSGDKFTPIGMQGTVKVSDFLNSLKIPSIKKKRNLVLTDDKDIIWVIEHRINEKFKIKPDTQKVLRLCLK